MELLETSKFYTADIVLPQFPEKYLEEERAALLGKTVLGISVLVEDLVPSVLEDHT